jgi:MFS family permease
LIVLLVLGHVAFAGDRFTLTLQAVALHASPIAIGILISLLMVVPMLLSIHMGRWADRLGYARPAALGLLMLAVGGLLSALAPAMSALYIASVFIGSGYTLAHVAVNNAVGQTAPAQQLTRSFSALAVGFSVSGLTGPMVAGVLIDHLGHGTAFLALVGFVAVSLALLLPLLRDPGRLSVQVQPSAPPPVMGLLQHEPLRAVLIVSALLSMGWDMFMFLAPLHGVRSGLSATSTGMLMAAFGAGTFAIRLLLPLLLPRMSEWRTLSWALFVTALCYSVFPLAATLPLMLIAAFAMGLSLGCGQPMAMSLLHLAAPPSRAGEAVGMRTSIVSASQTLFPLLFGALGSAIGVGAVFWAGATVLASGGAFARRRD